MLVWNIVIGCTVASFVNAAVIRSQNKQNYIFSRSCCPDCGHVLSFIDMLPVAGYLIRSGHCHYCGSRISVRYPLTEMLGAIAAIMSRNMFEFVLYMILLAVALYDMDTMIIRNRYLIMLMVMSFVVTDFCFIGNHLLGIVIISIPMRIIAVITKGFGFGDAGYLLLCKKAGMKSEMPFGPFLALGIRISFRYGFRLIDLYELSFIRVYN